MVMFKLSECLLGDITSVLRLQCPLDMNSVVTELSVQSCRMLRACPMLLNLPFRAATLLKESNVSVKVT